MKVKEVYHYLNVLDRWESTVERLMNSSEELLVDVTELHKRNAVMSTEVNEERKVEKKIKNYTYEDLYNLFYAIIEEKMKIYDLIEKKKIEKNMPDSIIGINRSLRELINTLKGGSAMSQERVTTRVDHSFVKTDNGVGTINYEVEVRKKPIYDSKFFLDKLDKLTKLADTNSNIIDSFTTNEEINYVAKWSEHSAIEDLIGK